MAYSRRRYHKRPARRYRRYRKSTVASKALYLARKANRTELKYYTLLRSLPITITTGTYLENDMQLIAQGTGPSNRIGLVINPTSINVKMLMKLSDLGSFPRTVRVVIYQWKSETADTSEGQYLQDNTVTSYKDETKRFQSTTLYDRSFSLSPGGVRQMNITIKRKLKGIISYSGSDNTTANRNRIYMNILQTRVSGDPDPEITYSSRLYYKDS